MLLDELLPSSMTVSFLIADIVSFTRYGSLTKFTSSMSLYLHLKTAGDS